MNTSERKQAKIAGLPRYFTGKPCLRGHISERYTASGICIQCQTEKRRREGEKPVDNSRKIAKSLGHKKYKSKSPCVKGHDSLRYTGSGGCVECAKEKHKRHRYKEIKGGVFFERRKAYRNKNRGLYVYLCQSRRKKTKLATPKWLTKTHISEMKKIYIKCGKLNSVEKNSHHVDHIIPINGKNVCGLHVPWNLQILTKAENLSKNNKVEV